MSTIMMSDFRPEEEIWLHHESGQKNYEMRLPIGGLAAGSCVT